MADKYDTSSQNNPFDIDHTDSLSENNSLLDNMEFNFSLDDDALADVFKEASASPTQTSPNTTPTLDFPDTFALPSLKANPNDGLPSLKAKPNDGLPSLKMGSDAPKRTKPLTIDGFLSRHLTPGSPLPVAPTPQESLPTPKSPTASDSNASRHRKTVALTSLTAFDNDEQENILDPLVSPKAPAKPAAASPYEDSTLGIPKLKLGDNGPHPVLKLDRKAPTGAFNESHDFDNDSGLPLADDPLSIMDNIARTHETPAPTTPTAATGPDILGLFTTPPDEPQTPAVPRLTAPTKTTADVKDKAATDTPNAVESHAPCAQSKDSAPQETNLPDAHTAQPKAAQEETDQEVTFDIQSIRESDAASRSIISSPKPPKKADSSKKKKRLIFALIAVVGVILCGLGIANFMFDESPSPENDLSQHTPVKHDVQWTLVTLDQSLAYQKFYKEVLEQLKQESLSASERHDLQGKILLNVVLGSIHHPELFSNDLDMLDNSAKQIATSCQNGWCALGLYSWGTFRNDADMASKFDVSFDDTPELSAIKHLVQAATQFSSWHLDAQSFSQVQSSGQHILDLLSKAKTLDTWMIIPWLKASTLINMGRHTDAIALLKNTHKDKAPHSPALAQLEFSALMAMDRLQEASDILDAIKNMDSKTPREIEDYEQAQALMAGATYSPEEFQTFINEFVKKHAKSPRMMLAANKACQRTQILSRCRTAFQTALENDKQNLTLRQAYAHAALSDQGIIRIARPDIKIDPVTLESITAMLSPAEMEASEDPALWHISAITNYAAGNFDAAIKAIDEIERGTPRIWYGAFLRHLIHYQTGSESQKTQARLDIIDAASHISQPLDTVTLAVALDYIGERQKALDLVEEAYTLHPEFTELLVVRLQLAIGMKNLPMAENCIRRLAMRKALKPEHDYAVAKLTENLGDINAALERMLTLISSQNTNPDFQFYVGELFYKKNRCDSAIPYFEHAIELDVNMPMAHYYKGRCLYDAGQFDAAITEFNDAATQNPNKFLYAVWNGISLIKLAQSSEALQVFTSVIDKYEELQSPSQEDHTEAAMAYFYRATQRKLINRRSEANDDFNKAIQLDPKNATYYEGYAVFLYESEQLNKCLAQIQILETLVPEDIDARALFTKGLALLKIGKRNDALEALEKAKEKGFGERSDSGIIGIREPAEIYERLGYLYRDMGRKTEAKANLTQFLTQSKTLSPSAAHDIQGDIDKL